MRSLMHFYLLFAGLIVQFHQYQTTVVKLESLFYLDIHNVNASVNIYNDKSAEKNQTQILKRYIEGSCIIDGNVTINRTQSHNKDNAVLLNVTRLVDIPCSPSNKSGTDIVTKGLSQIQYVLSHLTTNHYLQSVVNGSFHIFCGDKTIDNCEDVQKCGLYNSGPPAKCIEFTGTTESRSSESVTVGSVISTTAALSGNTKSNSSGVVTIGSVVGTTAALSGKFNQNQKTRLPFHLVLAGNTGSHSSEYVTIGSMVGTDAALSGNTGSHSSESVTIGSVVGKEQLSGSPSPNREKESDSSKAVTIGAVVGTVAALSGLVAAATFLRRKCKKNASVSDDTSDISSNVSSDLDDKLFFPRMFEINVASGRPPQKTAV